MLKRFHHFKIIILFIAIFFASITQAAENNSFYLDKTQVVLQQIALLKNRITQAEVELATLKKKQENQVSLVTSDHVNKKWLNWTKLDISVAKSNVDSITIEVSEAQQMTALLLKDMQDLKNKINAYNVFGSKMAKNGAPNLINLQSELDYQINVFNLEQKRLDYLLYLQSIADKTLKIYQSKYDRIETLLKSQTVMQLKERQSKNEINFQQQQDKWLRHLESLQAELTHLEQSKNKDHSAFVKVENEIFYANENVNFMYMQMLIARYQDQIQQLKLSTSRGRSIILLNKISEQAQALGKQFVRLKHLLSERMKTLEDRKSFLIQEKLIDQPYLAELSDLDNQYNVAQQKVTQLNEELIAFRATLDEAVQEELSSRQGLLGFSTNAWLDLGNDLALVPTLTYQVGKNVIESMVKAIHQKTPSDWLIFLLLESAWVMAFYVGKKILVRRLVDIPENKQNYQYTPWVIGHLFHRLWLDIGIIGNVIWFFMISHIPVESYQFFINMSLVWLVFKSLIVISKICFIETEQNVKRYKQFKKIFIFGGVITAIAFFISQLPLIYELKDLSYRLFLLFLAILSVFLFKSRKVLVNLLIPYVDYQHPYIKKIAYLLCFLIPLAIFVNALIGLFGFINFVLIISKYEGLFFLVFIGYLILKGMLSEVMIYISELLIAKVKNGWLYTEALLKPFEKICQVGLFFVAIAVLFFLYRWDKQSIVVVSLQKLLHYPLTNMLGTTITLVSLIELIVIILFICWAARWIREFVYRFIASRTNDLGVRTSMAILSQYTLIICGVLIGLRLLGIDLKALTFVVSAFALGVGLGLRDVANNFVCGLLLLFERPLRVGDTVCIGGFEGDVVKIGGRAVTIRTFDHMDVLVPNAEIFSKTFTNWTGQDHIVRTVVTLKINSHDNPQAVQSLIYDVLAHIKIVLKEPATEVFFKELAEGMIEFEVRYFINLSIVKSRMRVRSEVLMAIWQRFEEAGIQSPYPHREILLSQV